MSFGDVFTEHTYTQAYVFHRHTYTQAYAYTGDTYTQAYVYTVIRIRQAYGIHRHTYTQREYVYTYVHTHTQRYKFYYYYVVTTTATWLFGCMLSHLKICTGINVYTGIRIGEADAARQACVFHVSSGQASIRIDWHTHTSVHTYRQAYGHFAAIQIFLLLLWLLLLLLVVSVCVVLFGSKSYGCTGIRIAHGCMNVYTGIRIGEDMPEHAYTVH